MNESRLLWAGLGNFGSPIAEHCVEQGLHLSPLVWNGHNARGAQRLRALGCRPVTSAPAGRDYDALVLCLPRPADVRAVVTGLGPALPPVVIDLTTGDRTSSAALAAELRARGIGCVDAPVSGSARLARSGGLTVFAGTDEGRSETVDRLLRTVGKNVYYFKSPGAGQAAKLVNQLIHLATLAAVCEGLTFAHAESLDLPLLLDALQNSSANSQMLMRFGPSIVQSDFTPTFTLDLAAKDIEAVCAAVEGRGLEFTVTEAVREILRTAGARGLGSSDVSSMVQVISGRANPV